MDTYLDFILSQEWFQSEAEFYLDIEKGLGREEFEEKVLEAIDNLSEKDNV